MYISTRNDYAKVSAAQAVKLGMAPGGGLFVPERIPTLGPDEIAALQGKSYQEIAGRILPLYLDDYTAEEIDESIAQAYNGSRFSHPAIAPLRQVNGRTFVLELWHGPTAAFKDMALQIMPHLLSGAIKKSGTEKEIVILVATSGDTGKAALEGFKDVPGIKIIVFYPYKGVSKVQELQMSTTDGGNTYVVAVKGNFDDCQSAVKEIFGDAQFKDILAQQGYELSSANSINWGRLLPQIVYYFYAYADLLGKKEIQPGEQINFVVPTGNFGNILAGWYAAAMGLPIHKLICASNENKVLADFFAKGVYNRNRPFIQTMSPSMDILISSNLERFLFEMSDHDRIKLNGWMNELATAGSFTVDTEIKEKIDEILAAGYATEEETLSTIKKYYETAGYTLDTHTAVGMKVYEAYVQSTGDQRKTVLDATASPFKFNASVLKALKGEEAVSGKDEMVILEELSETTRQPVHPSLRGLDQKPVLHRRVCEKDEIKGAVADILKLNN
ncbi:MAG: threonine synthase [Clostridia bacterium]|jgi:threonine synthase|nr:threonine synthase [Clostridia bacterium]